MSRIRTIKPEFWTSEQVMECSPLARLLFIGLWNFCDDQGVHPASPKTIKAELFPADDISSQQVKDMLSELISNDLLAEFEAASKRYLYVTGWHHQLIKNPSAPKYPNPPATPALPQPYSSPVVGVPPVREGKGIEGNIKEEPHKERVVALPSHAGTRAHEGGSDKHSSKPKSAPIAPDWQPSAKALEVLATHGIAASFAMTCLPEFKLYWTERGDARPGWDASFVNSVKRSWEKRPIADQATGRRPGQTRVERMMEQHARLFGPNPEPDPFAADPKLIEGECYVHH